jgi:hypothetical protein
MKCPRCNKRNPDDTGFCEECGMALVIPSGSGEKDAPQYYVPPRDYAPQYSPEMTSTGEPKTGNPSKNWAAILGLVLGMISIPVCCIPAFFFLSYALIATVLIVYLVIGVAAVGVSILGMKSSIKGVAVAGLICGIAGIVFTAAFLIWWITVGYLLAAATQTMSDYQYY